MSNFDTYLHKITKVEPLSYEDEYALLEQAASGDPIARQRIAESRLKHVISLVWDIAALGDHILAANAGVLKGIDVFVKNPTKWKSLDDCIEAHIKKEIIED